MLLCLSADLEMGFHDPTGGFRQVKGPGGTQIKHEVKAELFVFSLEGSRIEIKLKVILEPEYVWATIDTAKEMLSVYHDSKLVVKYDYPLPKTSIDLSKIEL